MPNVTCRRCEHVAKVDDNGAFTFGAAARRQCMCQCADMDSLQRCRYLENSVALQLGSIAVAPGIILPASPIELRERRRPRPDME